MSKSLRDEMPETAAFLDSLREAFGAEMINAQSRKGLNGEPTFWAREGGHKLGTRDTGSTAVVKWDAQGVSYWDSPDWVIEARAFAKARGVTIEPADPADFDDAKREANELRELIREAHRQRQVQTSAIDNKGQP
jgi:hypothetical protein